MLFFVVEDLVVERREIALSLSPSSQDKCASQGFDIVGTVTKLA
jgi:hypothetical protein